MKFKDLVDFYKPTLKQEVSGFAMLDNSSPVEATWDFSSTDIPDVLKAVPIDAKPEDFKKRLIKRTFVSNL